MDQRHIHTQDLTGTGSAVSLSGVGFRVDGRDILNDLNFSMDVPRVGIVGRNGSGKSTLARLLAGLIAPTSGEIRVNGKDLAQDRKAALREVGILFQNPDHQIIFPTVLEEVAFGLTQLGQLRAEAEQNARATLQDFGKSHWADANVSTLSQGQKHLVCLMAVTAMNPNMLILDEPFAGLDIPTKAQLRRYLHRYSGTLVHISHDPDDLRGYDQMLWLDQGQIAQSGAGDAVLEAYAKAMIQRGKDDDLSDLSR